MSNHREKRGEKAELQIASADFKEDTRQRKALARKEAEAMSVKVTLEKKVTEEEDLAARLEVEVSESRIEEQEL